MVKKKQFLDKSTRKALSFIVGALIAGFSVMGFKEYGIISIIGVVVGVFFIIKALE